MLWRSFLSCRFLHVDHFAALNTPHIAPPAEKCPAETCPLQESQDNWLFKGRPAEWKTKPSTTGRDITKSRNDWNRLVRNARIQLPPENTNKHYWMDFANVVRDPHVSSWSQHIWNWRGQGSDLLVIGAVLRGWRKMNDSVGRPCLCHVLCVDFPLICHICTEHNRELLVSFQKKETSQNKRQGNTARSLRVYLRRAHSTWNKCAVSVVDSTEWEQIQFVENKDFISSFPSFEILFCCVRCIHQENNILQGTTVLGTPWSLQHSLTIGDGFLGCKDTTQGAFKFFEILVPSHGHVSVTICRICTACHGSQKNQCVQSRSRKFSKVNVDVRTLDVKGWLERSDLRREVFQLRLLKMKTSHSCPGLMSSGCVFSVQIERSVNLFQVYLPQLFYWCSEFLQTEPCFCLWSVVTEKWINCSNQLTKQKAWRLFFQLLWEVSAQIKWSNEGCETIVSVISRTSCLPVAIVASLGVQESMAPEPHGFTKVIHKDFVCPCTRFWNTYSLKIFAQVSCHQSTGQMNTNASIKKYESLSNSKQKGKENFLFILQRPFFEALFSFVFVVQKLLFCRSETHLSSCQLILVCFCLFCCFLFVRQVVHFPEYSIASGLLWVIFARKRRKHIGRSFQRTPSFFGQPVVWLSQSQLHVQITTGSSWSVELLQCKDLALTKIWWVEGRFWFAELQSQLRIARTVRKFVRKSTVQQEHNSKDSWKQNCRQNYSVVQALTATCTLPHEFLLSPFSWRNSCDITRADSTLFILGLFALENETKLWNFVKHSLVFASTWTLRFDYKEQKRGDQCLKCLQKGNMKKPEGNRSSWAKQRTSCMWIWCQTLEPDCMVMSTERKLHSNESTHCAREQDKRVRRNCRMRLRPCEKRQNTKRPWENSTLENEDSVSISGWYFSTLVVSSWTHKDYGTTGKHCICLMSVLCEERREISCRDCNGLVGVKIAWETARERKVRRCWPHLAWSWSCSVPLWSLFSVEDCGDCGEARRLRWISVQLPCFRTFWKPKQTGFVQSGTVECREQPHLFPQSLHLCIFIRWFWQLVSRVNFFIQKGFCRDEKGKSVQNEVEDTQ